MTPNSSGLYREEPAERKLSDRPPTLDERIERALREIGRAEPAPDLAARILARLPEATPRAARPPAWLGPVSILAALLSFALAYQTAFDLRANGAFDLLATYSSQPQIVTTYPNAAWDALAAAVPWTTVAVSLVALGLALILVYRLAGATVSAARAR